jgi:hypothetical protein
MKNIGQVTPHIYMHVYLRFSEIFWALPENCESWIRKGYSDPKAVESEKAIVIQKQQFPIFLHNP